MKTINIIKKPATALLPFILLLVTVAARPIVKISSSSHLQPLSVKYLGLKNEYLIFKVTVRADKLKRPELFVDESTAGSLYWKKLSSTTNIQWVKVKKADNLCLRFELVAPNKNYYKLFTANTLLVPQTQVLENKDLAAN
jgi:hypothetical protein